MVQIINIDVRVKDGVSLMGASKRYIEDGFDVNLLEYSSDMLDENPCEYDGLISSLPEADLIIVRITGNFTLFRGWDTLRSKADEFGKGILVIHNVPAESLQYKHLSRMNDADYEVLSRYISLGGTSNMSAAIGMMINLFDGKNLEISEPIVPPAQGYYYPGETSTDINNAINGLDASKAVIGILFSQRKWNAGNTYAVDRLIAEIESRGAVALPIFMTYAPNPDTGSIGIARIVDEWLLKDGKSVVDFLINTISSSIVNEAKNRAEDPSDPFLERLGVPVMQTPTLVNSEEIWRKDIHGLTNAEIAYDVAFPEFDGQIISVPMASTEVDDRNVRYVRPIDSRIGDVAEMAIRWANLRRKENHEKRIAVLFYNYPPTSGHVGSAAGLDTFQSIRDLLQRMSDDGYLVNEIPDSGQALAEMLMAGVTNDIEWLSDKDVRDRAVDMIGNDIYKGWLNELSVEERESIERDWGLAPGEILTIGDEMAVPGLINGNILLSFQPTRGKDIQASYHNHNCSIPHQYYAFYRWVRDVFRADVVIHVGTHGTLEWLPGKGVGLSKDCSPDYVLGQMPNLYPYVICNPGEGTQAKRRSYAVLVDHMIPAMTRAGSYDEVEELEILLQTFMRTESMKLKDQLDVVGKDLYDKIVEMDMLSDLKLPNDATVEQVAALADEIYDYVLDFKDNLIKDGLHIFGSPPDNSRCEEMVYSLCRLRNGDIPSLPESIAGSKGYDLRKLRENASEIDENSGLFHGELIDGFEDETAQLLHVLAECSFDPEVASKIVTERYPHDNGDVLRSVDYVCRSIHPNILRITEEIESLMDGMDGKYVRPGPSGCPTRGRADILPTGRNFYTLDPEAIPLPASWTLGKRMADQMVDRFREEKGSYPDSIGIVLWATDAMKTGGDDVAYVLWLMGVRPVWSGYGNRVVGLEIVGLEELGRPRIDVTVNISGLFRDAFPNLTEMINEAVRMVAELDESDEENRIRAHFREELAEDISDGIPEDVARREALQRVFGCKPGQYGTGVNHMMTASTWEDRNEIGNYYIDVGCHSYGKGVDGLRVERLYRRRLSKVDVTVKNSTSREYDLFDNDDVFQYLGGMNAAVEAVRGEMPSMSVIGCSADTDRPVLRTIQEESHYVFRSKVLNPKYEQGLRRHGFRGVTEILKMFEYIFAWDATSDIIENWMYDRLASHYLINDDVRKWMMDANPYAVGEMVDVLMEANQRGMWDASEEMLESLKEIYGDYEDVLEDVADKGSRRSLHIESSTHCLRYASSDS